MEALVLAAEKRLEATSQATHDPTVASDHQALHERIEALAAAQAEVDRLYARWAELEGKVKA
jgi:ATP-binding cassette subfamily F protein uup